MKLPSRRKPLTLILCCSLAGTLASSLSREVRAQVAPPLRVDPALLGLPPVVPKRPVAVPAESRPVEAPVVDARPATAPIVTTPPQQADAELSEPSTDGEPAAVTESAEAAPQVPPAPPVRQASPSAPRLAQPVQPPPAAPSPSDEVAQTTAPVSGSATAATATATAPTASESSSQPPVPTHAGPAVASAASADQREMVPRPKAGDGPQATFLTAQRITGLVEREVVAEDDAELLQGDKVLTADRMTYWPVDDEVEAVGSVRLQQGDDLISGPKMRLRLEEQFGFVEQATYFMKRQSPAAAARAKAEASGDPRLAPEKPNSEFTSGFAAPRALGIVPGQTKIKYYDSLNDGVTEARGTAERVDFEGENQIRLTSATYTTCKPGDDDWYLSVANLNLDYDNEVASGNDATVHFLGMPILYTPWMSFSLNNQRKSGFLTPTYGSSSDSGLEFTLPYYWNIAPNMDATFEPRIMTKRGLQLGTDVRYLNSAYGGFYNSNARVEVLPNDRVANIDRWGIGLNHSQTTANGFAGAINFSRVSDDDYYTDLSSEISKTSETQLLGQGVLSYGGGGWWSATANVQTYQTLQPDPKNPIAKPYRLLPQITVNARQPDLFATDSAFFGQFTSFAHPDSNMVEGQRTVLQPQVSLPYVTPGWYVTPRLGVNVSHYALSYSSSGAAGPESINRTLPIFSVDSGMTFERPSNWFGRDYTQTLEPRLFYLNIPYDDQNDIPIFDTGQADFNFAQIFADNQFSGWDRINNASQLTAALSSRLIDPATGSEIMRGMIGQRFYFEDDKVTLPGGTPRKSNESDFLAGFTGQILPRVYADAALQYDTSDQEFERYSTGVRYFPEAGKTINASYSYNTQSVIPIKQVDISGQWPISPRWQAVGRYNYSFETHNPIEIIGGLEYQAGCWVLRVVGHRLQTSEANSTTRAFVQLELSDFARVGSSPLKLLQRRISGYGVANQPMQDPALAEQ